MAKSVLDIVIKLSKQGGADKETITGLVKLKSAIMDAAAVAGTLVAAGYTIKKAFDATVGTLVTYADQVRDIAQVSGLSAEESSKLIQITDDLKISQEDLLKVMQKNGDQYDYSVAGLAAMSDQYRALQTSQEKAAFMQERFGKSWGNFVELMEQGSRKITQAGDDINEALILDQTALDQAREYEKQVDSLSDAWMAFKVSAGNDAIPYVVNALDILDKKTKEHGLAWAAFSFGFDDVVKIFTQGSSEMEKAANQADAARWNGLASIYQTTTATQEMADAVQVNYAGILSDVQKLSDAQMSYAEDVAQVNADLTLTDEERKVKLEELAQKHSEVTARIISDNMLQQLSVDGLEQAEFERVVAFQEATGLITSEAAQQALALNQIATAGANGTLSVMELKQAIDLLQSKTVTLTVNQVMNIVQRDTLEKTADRRAGYAEGTNGWLTVPSGFANDSYPIWLTSGEKFAVIPPGGNGSNVASGMGGGGGGAPVVVNVTMNSVVNTADRERAQMELAPLIVKAIRDAQLNGVLR